MEVHVRTVRAVNWLGMRFLTILLLLAGVASAGEYVLFASGGRMRVDGHEAVGSKIRLRTSQGSAEVGRRAGAGVRDGGIRGDPHCS